ncbi:uncharacterized protein LOC112598288 [Melanaphis sacchari]|uniref:uncharacterized protein LOC112598288 n=1 Tax=Melanaphis sacchari TaxID=742174 RepID=UPI000DC139B9|nr:uncharacterized protein LOC112598288 [Melanaphis sacchari]
MIKRKLLNIPINSVDDDDDTTTIPNLPKLSKLTYNNNDGPLGAQRVRILTVPKEPMLAYPLMDFTKIDKTLYDRGYENFIVEPKYDGERLLCVMDGIGGTAFFSRTLKPLSDKRLFDVTLVDKSKSVILDGERVYVDSGCSTDHSGGDDEDGIDSRVVSICDTGIRSSLKQVYMVFDIQAYDDAYVVHESLEIRQSLLRSALRESDTVRIVKSRAVRTLDGLRKIYEDTVRAGGEGSIVKDLRTPYTPGKRRDWIKLKPVHLREQRSEYDLYAHRALRDKNGTYGILECGYYKNRRSDVFVPVCRVASGLSDAVRNRIKLLVDPVDGLFRRRTVITVSADKITYKKSLRHPVFLRFSFEKDTVDDRLFTTAPSFRLDDNPNQ